MICPLPQAIQDKIHIDSLAANEIGESQSEVFKVSLRAGGFGFLKVSRSEYVLREIADEIAVLDWLSMRLDVPRPLHFLQETGSGYFLMTALAGENLADAARAGLSARECLSLGAKYLRKIHSLPIADCPFRRELKFTLPLAEKNLGLGLVDESDFDAERKGWNAADVYAELREKIPAQEDLVFTHGDYCFPNILVAGGRVSGVVDLGRAGVADRYQDIALFLRSFESNLAAADFDLFLEEYGLIRKLDTQKLEFYRILDEFF